MILQCICNWTYYQTEFFYMYHSVISGIALRANFYICTCCKKNPMQTSFPSLQIPENSCHGIFWWFIYTIVFITYVQCFNICRWHVKIKQIWTYNRINKWINFPLESVKWKYEWKYFQICFITFEFHFKTYLISTEK